MQVKELRQSLLAVKEALRDGAKVYVVGSHEDGYGYWYEIRKVATVCKLMHKSGDIILTENNFKVWCRASIVAVI